MLVTRKATNMIATVTSALVSLDMSSDVICERPPSLMAFLPRSATGPRMHLALQYSQRYSITGTTVPTTMETERKMAYTALQGLVWQSLVQVGMLARNSKCPKLVSCGALTTTGRIQDAPVNSISAAMLCLL